MTPGVPDPTRSLTPHTHREKTGVSLIHSPAMTSKHTNEDGLHCPNCGHPLTRLKSLRCPEFRMFAWKQRDNRRDSNGTQTCESGFARKSVLWKIPVSPVHLRESPLKMTNERHSPALTARGCVRFWNQ